jgi:chromosome segregation ATPase
MRELTLAELQSEVRNPRRRLELAEAKIAQQDGQFAFITGQLRDIQLYIHARFADIDSRFDRVEAHLDRMDERFGSVDRRLDRLDGRFDGMDARFDTLEQNIDALPRVLAEIVSKRS